MTTAQDRFRTVVRDRLAPALRSMGLRGSGQIYTLPSDTCWAQLGIQKAKWSDRDLVEFTVNLSVVSRAGWASTVQREPWRGATPSPNESSLVSDRFWERIGLVAGRGDYWWPLSADGRDEEATCADFLTVIEQHGVPVLQREVASRS